MKSEIKRHEGRGNKGDEQKWGKKRGEKTFGMDSRSSTEKRIRKDDKRKDEGEEEKGRGKQNEREEMRKGGTRRDGEMRRVKNNAERKTKLSMNF